MKIKWHYLIVFSILTLTACGVGPEVTLPPPTITSTPISTELPSIATAIPAGFNSDNPIQIVIVPADPEQAIDVVDDFEDQLEELTEVSITVMLAETQAEASALLCNSASGRQSAVWVNGMTYATSNLQGCGVGILQADTSNGTGEAGVLLLNVDYEDTGIVGAVNDTLCRISVDDLYSWILPTIFYSIEGFTVLDIDDVNELEDNDALIDAVTNGTCAAVGMTEEAWEIYFDEIEVEATDETDDEAEDETEDSPVFVAGTSPEIPFNVFAVPFSMPLDAIDDIETALIRMDVASGRSTIEVDDSDSESTEEPDTSADDLDVDEDMMNILFGEGAFQQVDETDFTDFIEFLETSEIDFAGLGN